MVKKLTDVEFGTALRSLAGWAPVADRHAMTKSFVFNDFSQAFAWMARVALLAERMDHHPEWFNVYNRVDVTLATHDAGGVSSRDVAMAEAMDGYAAGAS